MSKRRSHDDYFTPAEATRALLARVPVGGFVIEPCVGEGDLVKVLAESGRCAGFLTNDIDRKRRATTHGNAAVPKLWKDWPRASWVVSNPPFAYAPAIVPLAYDAAVDGAAMLLRLSYLEPCENRGPWLAEHPPTDLIVLPRISFTGDGKTDNVTCAWFVWRKVGRGRGVVVVPKQQESQVLAAAGQEHLFATALLTA